jgi:hypothetical protein
MAELQSTKTCIMSTLTKGRAIEDTPSIPINRSYLFLIII